MCPCAPWWQALSSSAALLTDSTVRSSPAVADSPRRQWRARQGHGRHWRNGQECCTGAAPWLSHFGCGPEYAIVAVARGGTCLPCWSSSVTTANVPVATPVQGAKESAKVMADSLKEKVVPRLTATLVGIAACH